jgi:hypothetical protein
MPIDMEQMVGKFQELLDDRDKPIVDGFAKRDGRIDTVEGRVSKIETVLNRKSFGTIAGVDEVRSFTDVLLQTKAFTDRPRELQRGAHVFVPLSVKDITGIGLHRPSSVPGIAPGPRQVLGVARLIPTTTVGDGGSISYDRELSFSNLAAAVAEGALKPKSDKTFQNKVAPFEVIAHYMKVSKQSYADASGLAGLIASNLIYGLNLKLESLLLKGTGVSPELQGLYPLATAVAAPTGTPTLIDTLFLAVSQLNASGYRADGIVMSNADYTAMQMLKDTTGRYLLGSIPDLPTIVVSPYMATGEWLVGDFSQTHLFVREESNIQVSNSNEDDFLHNMLALLAEMRAALVVFQPAALLKNPAGVAREAEPEAGRNPRR